MRIRRATQEQPGFRRRHGVSVAAALAAILALVAPNSASAATKAVGDPVKIGLINLEGGQGVSVPAIREAAQAAVKYANAELGGIGGRPINLLTCRTLGTPDSARSCANVMVDANVNAVFLGNDGNSDLIVSLITRAGIPYVNVTGNSPGELNTPGAFALTMGLPASVATVASYAKDKKWGRVVLMPINVAAAVGAINTFAPRSFSRSKVRYDVVPLTPGAADVTPQLAQALSKDPDAIWITTNDSLCIAVMKAYATLNVQVPLVFSSNTCIGAAVEKASPAQVYRKATLISTQFVGDNDAESTLFRRVMKTYSPRTDTDGISQRGYAGALGLIRALSTVRGEVTPAKAMAALKSAKNVPLPLGAGLKFTCDGKVLAGQQSVCSMGTIISQVLGGGNYRVIAAKDPSSLLR